MAGQSDCVCGDAGSERPRDCCGHKDGAAPQDLAIVSMNEKGFPQADLYLGVAGMPSDEFEACGMAPDTFFTMEIGDSLGTAYVRAQMTWPDAKVVIAEDDEPEED